MYGFDFAALAPLEKGWSGDRKYRAQGRDGREYVLRISPAAKREQRARCFALMRRVWESGVPMCEPVACGECGEGAYMLLGWVEGEDAEEALARMDADAQYAMGCEAGRILQKIHAVPAPEDAQPWETRYNRKLERKIAMYRECPVQYEGAERFIEYIEENRRLLADRPQTWQHGDYHVGNMIVGRDGGLYIIDFDRDDFGDPWEEFNRIVWCAQASPRFAAGMVDGYFDGRVPEEFWRLLALYIVGNQLSSVAWAIPYGQEQVDVMLRQAQDVLDWYDGMRSPVPRWY